MYCVFIFCHQITFVSVELIKNDDDDNDDAEEDYYYPVYLSTVSFTFTVTEKVSFHLRHPSVP